MTLSPIDRAFLERLSKEKQGRIGLTDEGHAKAREELSEALADGLLIERDLGFRQGFQLLPKGRAALAGDTHD